MVKRKSLKSLLSSLSDFKVYGQENLAVTGISSDSRKVKKGWIFIAVKGLRVNGHDFIEKVIASGVKVVIGERDKEKLSIPKGVTYVRVKDSRVALGKVASEWFGNPADKLKIIGVTGTDGKTTTTSLIYSLLKESGIKAALISTVSVKIGDKEYETGLHVTSPDPIDLHRFFAKMVSKKCTHAVIEVTSHGIDQKRVAAVDFDLVVLTNITHEHLDYHKTFKKYRDTKLNFLKSAKAVCLNKDDPSFDYLKTHLPDSQEMLSYSRERKADIYAKKIKDKTKGTNFYLYRNNTEEEIETSVSGSYNISNILAAVAVAVFFDIDSRVIKKVLRSFELPVGRLEKIDHGQHLTLYIDFAHTPNSLEKVLTYLRGKTKGKLIVVFGAAGERDIKKRFLMGEISGRLADISIFTAEDPRKENIQKILSMMAKGAKKSGAGEIKTGEKLITEKKVFTRITERGEAIFAAIDIAGVKDTVVITGKAHEKSMAYKGLEHPWSDHRAVEDAIKADAKVAAIILGAGRGTRMKSETQKVLREIAGRPMIAYTLQNLRKARFKTIIIVVWHKKTEIMKAFGGAVIFAEQAKMLGTGDAVKKGLEKVPRDTKTVVVLNGDDSAFYKPGTIRMVINRHKIKEAVLTFVSLVKKDPEGLGRVVRNGEGKVASIVEEKDATNKQKKIKEVNDGLYVFDRSWLSENLGKIKKSSVGEYYLVDLVKIALRQDRRVEVYRLEDSIQWQGVNTIKELAEADAKMIKILKKSL